MRKHLLNPKLVWTMALLMTVLSVPPQAMAFPSQSLAQTASVRDAQIERVMSVLSRPQAQTHLQLMRIDQSQLRESLTKLDDSELAQVTQRAESIKAAGDGLGIIVTVLLIVLLVVLIMKINDRRIVVK
jgi:hypothetical protein